MSAADREYTASTPDETVWVRVGGAGEILGVQLEPPVMLRPGPQIADRIQACADVAYFEAQLALRAEWERNGAAPEALAWMATPADLETARTRLRNL